MAAKGTARTTRLRKVQCPGCGCIGRFSRSALVQAGLPSCGCGERMTCPDLDDLAIVAPEDPRLTAADHALQEFMARSVQQQNRQARKGRGAFLTGADREAVARERGAAVIRERALADLAPVVARNTEDEWGF